MKKDCAFQYAYNELGIFGNTGNIKIEKDTELITLDEAKKLWEEYLPDFINRLKQETNPEMAIWINMKSDTDYRETLVHADSETRVDSQGNLYNVSREYLSI